MQSQVSDPAMWNRVELWNANVIEHVAKGLYSTRRIGGSRACSCILLLRATSCPDVTVAQGGQH